MEGKHREQRQPANAGVEWVTPSEIGTVEFCPESYRLQRAGAKRTLQAQVKAIRGQRHHAAVNRDVAAAQRQHTDSRCFIASHLYGAQDPRTHDLRHWRDATLQHTRVGRVAIALYYGASPWIVRLARRHPWVDRILHRVLDGWVLRIRARQHHGER